MKEYYSLKFKDIVMDNINIILLDSISSLNIYNKGFIRISYLKFF